MQRDYPRFGAKTGKRQQKNRAFGKRRNVSGVFFDNIKIKRPGEFIEKQERNDNEKRCRYES